METIGWHLVSNHFDKNLLNSNLSEGTWAKVATIKSNKNIQQHIKKQNEHLVNYT